MFILPALVNITQAIGLSVEFVSHVVRGFSLNTSASRKRRTIEAMTIMGPAVTVIVLLESRKFRSCIY